MTTEQAPKPYWVPNPRQKEVLSAVKALAPEHYGVIGYGGAAGGAKTNLLANLAFVIGKDIGFGDDVKA